MTGHFVVIAGPDRGLTHELSEAADVFPIGRARQATLRLTDLTVSRYHCQVNRAGARLVLQDVGGLAGVFVNGERVQEHELQAGDVIRLGQTQLRFLDDDLADQPTLPPEPPVVEAAPPTPPEPERAANKPPPLPAERMTELTGEAISHYRIGPLLARGVSGLVFKGWDFKHNRDVALKVLRPEFSENRHGVQRFIRAMKTMLPLRHPNLVSLYGAGKTGPYCWIAMEYIEGESLAQVLHRIGVAGMLDWRSVLRIAAGLTRGLVFAHEHQIIHRNITPQNTLLRTHDKQALLGDLMLAKAMEGELAMNVTRSGEVLGDIRFVSPERLAGTRNVDARSDIYSLGALIYALLTGHAPHEGENVMETLSLIHKGEPVRPKKFQMSIADAFEGVVMTMLHRHPEKRYQSADRLLADLESVAKFTAVEL